jgi:hypothetical protein
MRTLHHLSLTCLAVALAKADPFPGGWLVSTNLNNVLKESRAARVAARRRCVVSTPTDAAHKEYRSCNRRSQTERSTNGARRHGRRFRGNRSLAIPEAWRELVEKGTEVYSNT